jgi:hypothetical protein
MGDDIKTGLKGKRRMWIGLNWREAGTEFLNGYILWINPLKTDFLLNII